MSSYMQMGHDTENLVGEKGLTDYTGIILSPVNRYPDELIENSTKIKEKNSAYDIVLDPQLYFPRNYREKLAQYPYFPSDIDTADISSINWWESLLDELVAFSDKVTIDSIISPAVIPKTFNLDYYSTCAEITQNCYNKLSNSGLRLLEPLIVDLSQLTDDSFIMSCASIASQPSFDGYYLILVSNKDPRRELSEADELFGALKLVYELEASGKPVLISNCSSDMMLFKAAGASNCATGKFFNLRRFTKSRFEEPSDNGGGGQLPYWFEQSLIAFLRQADILRLKEEGYENLIGNLASSNMWSQRILDQFKNEPQKAWVALGWRQFLNWFCITEKALDNANSSDLVKTWLKKAEDIWIELEDNDVFFEERRNDGKWLRSWRQALRDLNKYISE